MRVTPQALGIQPKPKPQPLVNRCRDCGRQISDNKSWCYKHLLKAIAQVASGEPVAAEIVLGEPVITDATGATAAPAAPAKR